jgi:hypothetical protein
MTVMLHILADLGIVLAYLILMVLAIVAPFALVKLIGWLSEWIDR